MSIDKTSKEKKAEIIEKIKRGQALLYDEEQELFFMNPFRSLLKDNIVDVLPKKEMRNTFISDMAVILEIDDKLYSIDWKYRKDHNENIFWIATRPYEVKKVEKVIVEYERIKK